jgi:hypothetical protein
LEYSGYIESIFAIINQMYINKIPNGIKINNIINNKIYNTMCFNNLFKSGKANKTIKIAVVGQSDSGKTHLLVDMMRALIKLGYVDSGDPIHVKESDNKKIYTNYAQIKHFTWENYDKTIKSTQGVGTQNVHFKSGMIKNNQTDFVLEFMNIPGERFKSEILINSYDKELKPTLKKAKKVFIVEIWENNYSTDVRLLINFENNKDYETVSKELANNDYTKKDDSPLEKINGKELWNRFYEFDSKTAVGAIIEYCKKANKNFKVQNEEVSIKEIEIKKINPITGEIKIEKIKVTEKNVFDESRNEMKVVEVVQIDDKEYQIEQNKVKIGNQEYQVKNGKEQITIDIISELASTLYYLHFCEQATDVIFCDRLVTCTKETEKMRGSQNNKDKLLSAFSIIYRQKKVNHYFVYRGLDALIKLNKIQNETEMQVENSLLSDMFGDQNLDKRQYEIYAFLMIMLGYEYNKSFGNADTDIKDIKNIKEKLESLYTKIRKNGKEELVLQEEKYSTFFGYQGNTVQKVAEKLRNYNEFGEISKELFGEAGINYYIMYNANNQSLYKKMKADIKQWYENLVENGQTPPPSAYLPFPAHVYLTAFPINDELVISKNVATADVIQNDSGGNQNFTPPCRSVDSLCLGSNELILDILHANRIVGFKDYNTVCHIHKSMFGINIDNIKSSN